MCPLLYHKGIINFYHTLYLCVYFDANNKHSNTINSLKRLVFIMNKDCVLCEIGGVFFFT